MTDLSDVDPAMNEAKSLVEVHRMLESVIEEWNSLDVEERHGTVEVSRHQMERILKKIVAWKVSGHSGRSGRTIHTNPECRVLQGANSIKPVMRYTVDNREMCSFCDGSAGQARPSRQSNEDLKNSDAKDWP